VDGVDLTLPRGGIAGVVGESGCGKSMTLLSIMRLVPYPGRIVDGGILFEGRDLVRAGSAEMRDIRGSDVAMVFQDPMTTLNPVFRVGEQIRESLRVHGIVPRSSPFLPGLLDRRRLRLEKDKVLALMEEVGIPSPRARYLSYPHQFSGGMQQRALIAVALACEPKLLLADEPTTALDVTIQAQTLDLLRSINDDHGTGVILVTHDLGVAAEFCQEIYVMYAGKIVEQGPTAEVMAEPLHPYTRGLLRSIPRLGGGRGRLAPIPGNVPDLSDVPAGCAFRPRCPDAIESCREEVPFVEVAEGRWVRCPRVK